MATFSYKIKDKSGNTHAGSIEADDRRSAVSELQGMGYWVLDAREAGVRTGDSWNPIGLFVRHVFTPVFGGAPIRSVAVFYRQLATMITAGLSLSQALNSLGGRAPTRRLSAIAREAARQVEGGGRVSDAFARHPVMFPELHISLLRAGEAGGSVDRMLERIADYMERDYKIRQRLRMATLYPKLLVLAVIFIPSLPTLVLEGGRPYLDETLARLVPLLLWVTGLYVGYLLLCQVPVFRYGVDLCKLAIPKIGSTVKMLGLSKFYRAFASLYDAGTSPSMAISHASRVCGNWFLTRKLQSAIPMVESGRSFTEAMEQTRIMPRMAIDMLAVGEQAGNVAEMVDKVADFTENEAEVQTHQMTMILGVLLILGVALFIGFQVVGYYMGYYNQILNMK